MKRTLLIVLGLVLAFFLIFGGTLWNRWTARQTGPDLYGVVPDFSLPAATAEGPTSLSLEDLKGDPWLVNFVFTHCSGPCPLMSTKMARLQGVVPENVRLVSFTVDPERDDLDVLAEYARQYEADQRWFFVRADKPTLYKIVFEGFKLPMMEDPAAESGYRVIHSPKFVLVDGKGRIRNYFESSDERFEKRILTAINNLEKEKP